MGARVCKPLRLLITSGTIWTLHDWLNKFSCFSVSMNQFMEFAIATMALQRIIIELLTKKSKAMLLQLVI